jgi:transcriptional regulator with XRE-family HTH domain
MEEDYTYLTALSSPWYRTAMQNPDELRKELRKLRLAADVTLQAVADEAGVSRQFVAGIEAGLNSCTANVESAYRTVAALRRKEFQERARAIGTKKGRMSL